MTQKLLFWLNEDLTYYCIANSVNRKIDCELYGIIDVRDEGTKNFLQNQQIVKFENLWSTHDEIMKRNKKPDLEYLEKFEEKFNINLWEIAYSERHFFPKYNQYYRFTRNEILSIMEQECKLFENVLNEARPDYLFVNLISRHASYLLYRMCKTQGIGTLTLEMSKFGTRWVISHEIDKIDNPSDYAKIKLEKTRTRQELLDYLKLAKPLIGDEYNIQKKVPKSEKIHAAIDYMFSSPSDYYENVFLNYGKTKLKILMSGSTKTFFIKKSRRESFMEKNLPYKIDDDVPFVYFPLHADPERELQIQAHYYSDQIAVITNIAKALPVGYNLCVKDHPFMHLRGWREIDFYQKIMDIPNVRLIHPQVKSTELIKKSSLVITLVGTSGLEAAFYEKPAITLTQVDYSVLPFVYYVENIKNLPQTIKTAIKTKVDLTELDKYVTYVHQNSFEFDKPGYFKDFLNRFPYVGFQKPLEIPTEDMKSFLKDKSKVFDKLADEHINKMI